MNTIIIGIIIACIILIAVIKYRSMQYNYKAATAVLLRNLLVEKYGMKHDFAEQICMEIYGVKEGDFFRMDEVAVQGAEHLESIFNDTVLRDAIMKECETLKTDPHHSEEFERVKSLVVSRFLAQLTNKKE